MTNERRALALSSAAKFAVFRAHDAAECIEDEELRRVVRRRLIEARDCLESVDRVVRDAIEYGSPRVDA